MDLIRKLGESISLPRWVERLPEALGSKSTGQRIRKFLGPAPKGREIRFACCAGAVIPLLILISSASGMGDSVGWKAGQHFVAFYDAGTILNRGRGSQLYDLNLQTELFQKLFPSEEGTSLYPNAPWFALLFRPFALLSFRWAYLAWVLFSIALYVSGLALVWPDGFDAETRRTAFLAAVSFQPFAFQTLISGQVTAVAFFLIAAAMHLLRRGHSLAAGLVLSGCLYKPPMLLLLLPMLFFSGRWKALAGVAGGALSLALISVLCVAPSSLASFWHLINQYSNISTTHQGTFLVWPGKGVVQSFPNFIDGHHFFTALPGGDSIVMLILAVASAAFLLYLLVPAWIRADSSDPGILGAIWGSTITFTLILNLHAQHYDSVLLPLAVLVSCWGLASHPQPVLRSAYFRVCVLLWCTAWVSQFVTHQTGIQVLTLAILLLGLLQIATIPRLAASPADRVGAA